MNKSYIQYIREMVGDKMIMLNATAVVIVNQENQVLLQKRSDNLMWGLPGGLLEMDESITEGAVREVKEDKNLIEKKRNLLNQEKSAEIRKSQMRRQGADAFKY